MKFAALLVTLLAGQSVLANTLSVEFKTCGPGNRKVCAIVYVDQTTGQNYHGQEMLVEEHLSQALSQQIISSLQVDGNRSLTMNIEGKVTSERSYNGPYNQLTVYSMTVADKNASRPRGFQF